MSGRFTRNDSRSAAPLPMDCEGLDEFVQVNRCEAFRHARRRSRSAGLIDARHGSGVRSDLDLQPSGQLVARSFRASDSRRACGEREHLRLRRAGERDQEGALLAGRPADAWTRLQGGGGSALGFRRHPQERRHPAALRHIDPRQWNAQRHGGRWSSGRRLGDS